MYKIPEDVNSYNWSASIERLRTRYDSLRDYVDYYNERRLHVSLDIDNGETPLQE